VACAGDSTKAVGADLASFAYTPSAGDAENYIKALDQGATVDPSCASVTLGVGSALCDFTETSGGQGLATMYIGSNFTFETGSTSDADCSLLGDSDTTGASVLVFTPAGSDEITALLYCGESTTALGLMRSALYAGTLNLKA
jgi:hypothetical protein